MIIRDGDWRLVDADLKLGRQVWRRENPDGSTTVRTDYSVTDVLDANQAARADAPARFGDWTRIASVPLGEYYAKGLADAQAQQDGKFIDRYLSDNSKFRTR